MLSDISRSLLELYLASIFDLKNGLYKILLGTIVQKENIIKSKILELKNLQKNAGKSPKKTQRNSIFREPSKTRSITSYHQNSEKCLKTISSQKNINYHNFVRKMKSDNLEIIPDECGFNSNKKNIGILNKILKIILKIKFNFSYLSNLFFYENIAFEVLEEKNEKIKNEKFLGFNSYIKLFVFT